MTKNLFDYDSLDDYKSFTNHALCMFCDIKSS